MAGVKGRSGRKTKYEELDDAQRAFDLFFGEQNQAELEAKIMSGKFALADRFKLNGMEGDTKVLVAAAKKALPDAVKVEHEGEIGLKIDV